MRVYSRDGSQWVDVPTPMNVLPMQHPAARLDAVAQLARDADDEGNPVTPIITREQLMALLYMLEDP